MSHDGSFSSLPRFALALSLAVSGSGTWGQSVPHPGVTDSEIRIGQTAPYSGPASSWATIARTQAAYFEKLNASGGISGRKIKFISVDDGYNPAKTLEATRRLVEEEQVLINDDFGKELLAGLVDGLGVDAKRMLVATASYDLNDPVVDSQVISLRAAGADTFVNFALPKAAAQSIRKAYDSGWKPLQYLNYVSNLVGEVLAAGGLEKSIGILSADNLKDPTDVQWENDSAMKEWLSFMKSYYPRGDITDNANVYAYNVAQLLEHVLRRCGEDLSSLDNS